MTNKLVDLVRQYKEDTGNLSDDLYGYDVKGLMERGGR